MSSEDLLSGSDDDGEILLSDNDEEDEETRRLEEEIRRLEEESRALEEGMGDDDDGGGSDAISVDSDGGSDDAEVDELEEEAKRLEEEMRRLDAELAADEGALAAGSDGEVAAAPDGDKGDAGDDDDDDEEYARRMKKLEEERRALEEDDDDDGDDGAQGEAKKRSFVPAKGIDPSEEPTFLAPVRQKRKEEKDEDDAQLDKELELKFDQFKGTVGEIEEEEQKRVTDRFNEDELKNLQKGGAQILSAMNNLRASEREGPSLEAVTEQAGGGGGKDGGKSEWGVVLPTYLRGFTGEQPKKKLSDHIPKYYVDIFTKACPEIVEKASYAELFGEVSEEDASGLFIWRIEELLPIEVDEDEYPNEEEGREGRLNVEECYVILHITDVKVGKKFSLFNWVGEEASLDKRGASAIRAHELNLLLHGRAIHRTEFQGEESEAFFDCFGEVELDYGDGTESAFRKAERFVQESRMYQVMELPPATSSSSADDGEATDAKKERQEKLLRGRKARARYVLTQVDMAMYAMNQRDVFLLDSGRDQRLFLWCGKFSSKGLRWVGAEVTRRINAFERASQCALHILEQGEEAATFSDARGTYAMVDYLEDHLDEVPARGQPFIDDMILYRTDISSGKTKMAKVRDGPRQAPLSRAMLRTENACILDAFCELYVWLGRGLSQHKALKQHTVAEVVARKLAAQEDLGRPSWTPVHVVHEGSEPMCFISKFPDWFSSLCGPHTEDFERALFFSPERLAPAPGRLRFDPKQLTEEPALPQDFMPDDGGGGVEVWAVEDGTPKFSKLPKEERGEFFTADCYLVLYTYRDPNFGGRKQSYALYFWEGRSASRRWFPAFIYGFYPVLQRKIRNAGGKAPYVARIQEHQEPDHFMLLFGGTIIVHEGHRRERRARLAEEKQLFHLRRDAADNTYAVEVPAESRFLNSRDAFVLRTPKQIFVWYGKGVGYEDSQAMLGISELLQGERGEMVQVDEGDEEAEFWNLLGGWVQYDCDGAFFKKYSTNPVRLHRVTREFGAMRVVTEPLWSQSLLMEHSHDAFLLDTHHELYVWGGDQCSESLLKATLELANKFLRWAAKDRGIVVDIALIPSGEPLPAAATRHFHTWVETSRFHDPMEGRMERYYELEFARYKEQELLAQRQRREHIEQARAKAGGKLKRVDMDEVARREIQDLDMSSEEYEAMRARRREEEECRLQLEIAKYEEDLRHEFVDYDEVLRGEAIAYDEEDKDLEKGTSYSEIEIVEEKEVEKKESAAAAYVDMIAKRSRHHRIYGKKK